MADTSRTVEIRLQAKDESGAAFASINRSMEGIKRSVEGLKGIALAELGIHGLEDAAHGVIEFGKSLIDANAEMEMMRQRLNILYSSAAEGARAFSFLQQNELTKPFDIESIMTASTQLVAFKQDITTVLPALEDVAGAMGQKLPVAARAFNDALMGRFAMLKNDLGVSKEMLVQFGLEMDKRGHITDPASFTRAFLALANSPEFKGGADKLAQTWTGLMSSMSSQWFYLKANLGQGLFDTLEKQLGNVVHTLQDPKVANGIRAWEVGIGNALGAAVAGAIRFAQTIGPYVGSAIIVGIRAFGLLRGALSTIGDNLHAFFGFVAGNLPVVLNAFQAGFTTVLPIVTTAWAAGLDLLSGNWSRFQSDINKGTTYIAGLLVDLFAGIEEQFGYDIGTKLMGPWTQLAIGVRDVFRGIGNMLAGFVSSIASGMMNLEGMFARTINAMIGGYNAIAGKLHLPKIAEITDLTTQRHMLPGGHWEATGARRPPGFVGPFQAQTRWVQNSESQSDYISQQIYKQISDTFARMAPGIDHGQAITPGVSRAQFVANIEARRKQLLHDLGLDAGGAGSPYYNPGGAGGAGGNVMGDLRGLFAGLGGNMTLADFARSIGINIGNAPGLPGIGPLPVPGPMGGAEGTSPAAGGGGASGLRSASGRVSAGQLGAQFMQTLASGTQIGAGTDPATRAAQAQVTGQQRQIAQGDRHTTLLERVAALAEQQVAVLARVANPPAHPSPVRPTLHHGVARPVI